MTQTFVVPDKTQYIAVGADPAAVPGRVSVYSKLVTGVAQLFMEAGDGTVTQIGGGGGGGGVIPVIGLQTSNFTAAPNTFYTLGTPGGKGFAVVFLPDPAANPSAVVGLKLMVNSQGWQVNAAPFSNIDGWSDLPGPRKQYSVFWVKSNGASWMITSTYEVITHPSSEQFYPATGTVVADPDVPVTVLGTATTGALTVQVGVPKKGLGTVKYFVDIDVTGDQTDVVRIQSTALFQEDNGTFWEFDPGSPGAGEPSMAPKLTLVFTMVNGNEFWAMVANNRFKRV